MRSRRRPSFAANCARISCLREIGRWNTFEAARSARASASPARARASRDRSEEHTSELQSLMRISYAVFCLKKKKQKKKKTKKHHKTNNRQTEQIMTNT